MTKTQLKQELIKCGKSPAYFLSNYVKIPDPNNAGVIPFHVWDYQEDLLQNFLDHRRNVIVKSRQLGISTITAGYCTWLMLFRRNRNINVIAIDFETAKNLLDKVRYMLKSLPEFFTIGLAKKGDNSLIQFDNRTSLVLTNGSKMKALPAKDTAGRSEALSLLVLDEAAHIDAIEEIWSAAKPTMDAGGKCIALSTPFGVGNWFHNIWEGSVDEEDPNGWHGTRLMWDVHPNRDEDWLEEQKKEFSPRYIAQEYECSFLASGGTVVDAEILDKIKEGTWDPLVKVGFDSNYWIWEEYIPGEVYFITGDTARGDGEDNSAFHVWRASTMEQVAEYHGKCDIDTFANILYDVGTEYGDALIAVENAGLGHEVSMKLVRAEYKNVYFQKKGSHEHVPQWEAVNRVDCVPGVTMSGGMRNSGSRPIIIGKLEEFTRLGLVRINSIRTAMELRYFIWNNGRPEAMKGKNDDLVMALAIGCWLRDIVLSENQVEVGYKTAILKSARKTNTKLNTAIPGQMGYNKAISFDIMKKQQIKERQKYSWILKG